MDTVNDSSGNIKTTKVSLNIIIINILLGFSIILAIILSFRGTKASVRDKGAGISFVQKGNAIRVINIYGIIEYQKMVSYVSDRLKAAMKDKSTKGVILRINSGGGTVGASESIYRQISNFKKKSKKPVVAVIGDIAASGGYYIACSADKIIARSGSLAGSIGVIVVSFSFKGLFNKLGVKQDIIKSGEFKDIMTAIGRDKTPKELELLQQSVDTIYKQFFNIVLLNRKGKKGLTEKILRKYADGRVLTGARANDIGLIDSIGGLKEGINYIKSYLKIKDEVRIIEDSKSMLERLFTVLNYNERLSMDSFLKGHSSRLPLYLYIGGSGL